MPSQVSRVLAIGIGSCTLAILSTALCLASVHAESTTPAIQRPRPPTPSIPAKPGDWLEDTTAAAGIGFVHHFFHERIANILLSNGSGGAVFDFNNDGWIDVFLLDAAPLTGVTDRNFSGRAHSNRLYQNDGHGRFDDVTSRAGLTGGGFGSAAAAGDFDNDGFTDLFVANIGRSALYRNCGDGTFIDATDRAGVGHEGAGISAVFLDYDKDGWLDLFLANYLTYVPAKASEQNPGAYPGPLAYTGEQNVLYRNRGDGTFEDVTAKTGLARPGHRAMSVTAFDANRDGWVDLYVCNDDTPNALWLNDGQGHFADAAIACGTAFNSIGEAPGSMNATVADVNLDGWPDLFVTRLGYGSLYLRTDKGFYDDRMWASGLGLLTQKFVGWGGAFLDADNDSDPDLFIANGDAFHLEGTLPLFLLNSGNGTFTNAAQTAGPITQTRINGRGNAVLDYDNDGRLDLLLTALADRPFLLRNRCPLTHYWLKVQLRGTRSNRNGYGSLLTIRAGDLVLKSEALCPTGFLMQGDARPHFGLRDHPSVDQLEIRWPSGSVQLLTNLPANQVLQLTEPSL